MKQLNLTTLKLLFALGAALTTSSLMAQQYKLDIDKPNFDSIESPDIGGNTGVKKFKAGEWLEAEVKFKIEASDKKILFVDKVTIKWYVAAENPEGKGFLLLSKEVNHINVPVGEEIHASVYLSPTSVKRLSGGDRASKNIISHIGGEILVNGVVPVKDSGLFTSKDKPRWWNAAGLSDYDKIPLLNKDETPFKFLWWDRYAEIEVPR